MNTTTATDALLALMVAAGIVYLRRTTPASPMRSLWLWALGVFGAGAIAGAAFHWNGLSDDRANVLWRGVSLLVIAAASLIAVCAVGTWRGYPSARRLVPFALALAGTFFLTTWRMADDLPLIFSATATLFAFAVLGALAVRRQPGPGLVAVGLGTGLAGALVQWQRSLAVQFIWRFDHNGLFHLVQVVGIALVLQGLRRILQPRAAPAD